MASVSCCLFGNAQVISRRLSSTELMTRTADEVLAVALKEGADELVVGIPVVMDGNINDFRTDSKHVSQTFVDNARADIAEGLPQLWL